MIGDLFTLGGVVLILSVFVGAFVMGLFGKPLMGKKSAAATLATGIGMFMFPLATFYAEPGMSYLVQYPWGQQSAVLSPGYHARFFGNLIPFNKYLTVSFNEGGDIQTSYQHTAVRPAIPIRFNDAVTADVSLTLRFQMPVDEISFQQLAIAFRSQDNLVTSSLIPTVREVVRNAGRMISAQDYIGGKGGHFEDSIADQLKHGIVLLDIITTKTHNTEANVSDLNKERTIDRREVIKYEVLPQLDANGELLRKANMLIKNHITLTQSTVERVNPESRFKEMLSKQRDAAAQANVERQEAKKAEFQKQRIIAEGEAEKAGIRVEEEKSQIRELISAETETKRERLRVERIRAELEGAKLEALAVKVRAEAEAGARRLLMQADGALDKKLAAFVEINKNYAEALKGNKQLVPTVVLGASSGGKNSGTALDLVQLLTAKTARDLALTLRPDTK